jgi:hypothetical protein
MQDSDGEADRFSAMLRRSTSRAATRPQTARLADDKHHNPDPSFLRRSAAGLHRRPVRTQAAVQLISTEASKSMGRRDGCVRRRCDAGVAAMKGRGAGRVMSGPIWYPFQY